MIIKFRVARKDNAVPIPNARVEVEKAEAVVYTDTNGEAEIITYWEGNFRYSVAAPGYDNVTGTVDNRDAPSMIFSVSMGAIATPPPQNRSGEREIERFGTSCSIVGRDSFGKEFFWLVHDRAGTISNGYEELPPLREKAKKENRCYEIPPPPPPTLEDVQTRMSDFEKAVNTMRSGISFLEESITSLGAMIETLRRNVSGIMEFINGIDDWFIASFERMKDTVIGWIESAFISILERVLEQEKPS